MMLGLAPMVDQRRVPFGVDEDAGGSGRCVITVWNTNFIINQADTAGCG